MNERYYHDPNGAKGRAREARILELMKAAPDHPLASHRHYCELVYDNEEAPLTTDRAELEAAGHVFPPEATLDDQQVKSALARLVEELARMRTFLCFTNHLTDRELYRSLLDGVLREERRDTPISDLSAVHLDLSEYRGGQGAGAGAGAGGERAGGERQSKRGGDLEGLSTDQPTDHAADHPIRAGTTNGTDPSHQAPDPFEDHFEFDMPIEICDRDQTLPTPESPTAA